MNLVRIGDKTIDKKKIYERIESILYHRERGLSQKETASELGLERSFISRLEGLGEIRKGGKIAIIGFPIENTEELKELALIKGVDFCFLLSEEERWQYIKQKSGLDLFNEIMDMLQTIRSFDKIIIMGSKERIKMLKAVLERDIYSIELGDSPLSKDIYVNPQALAELLEICS